MLSARLRLLVAIAATAICLIAAPAPAADYYAGKSIDFIIGSDVGGGYDIYARVSRRHLSRHIPGNPTIVAEEPARRRQRPGRGLHLFGGAEGRHGHRRGLSGRDHGAAARRPGAAAVRSDQVPVSRQRRQRDARLCVTHERSQDQDLRRRATQKTIMGASAAGGSTRDYANMHRKTTGAQFELVTRLQGHRRHLSRHGARRGRRMCGLDWTSLKSQRPDWVRDRTVNILVQVTLEPEAELTRLGVPRSGTTSRAPTTRRRSSCHRPAGVRPPLSRAARASRLSRSGSCAPPSPPTMQDKDFLADAEKTRDRRGTVVGRAGAATGRAALRHAEGDRRARQGPGQAVTR